MDSTLNVKFGNTEKKKDNLVNEKSKNFVEEKNVKPDGTQKLKFI